MKIKNDFEVRDYVENKEIRRGYLQKTNSFKKSLEGLLINSKTEYHVIEKRIKEIKSLKNKLEKKITDNSSTISSLTISKSEDIKEITDLSGIRVIVFYLEDVRQVLNLICQVYKIDEVNSNFFLSNSEYDRFGYQSVHVIVEWESIKIEVQIRTVLQHAWAAISHKMDYKSVMKSPYQLKRKLSRLSGLIEIADNEFNDLKTEYPTDNIKEDKTLFYDPIDYSSLSAYFIKPNRFLWYIRYCEFSGQKKTEPSILIPKTFDFKGRFKEIVECCQSLSFRTIKEFDEFLRKNLIIFKNTIRLYLKYGNQPAAFFSIDQRLLFLMHIEMNSLEFQKICAKNNYHEIYSDLVIKIKNEVKCL